MVAMDRKAQLGQWFTEWSNAAPPCLQDVAGDASFRRYYRAEAPVAALTASPGSSGVGISRSVVLCDAPPDSEKNHEFHAIATALHDAAVRVPAILHMDLERGFFVLEDLGDQLLLPLLTENSADAYYSQALEMLEGIAMVDCSALDLPHYDSSLLNLEMELFPTWFCEGLLDMPLDKSASAVFAALRDRLCKRALAQPSVLVHRDFHARNLMRLTDGSLATIDFQDAVLGPVCYDAVSLLRDCYRRWPLGRVYGWARAYRQGLVARGLEMPSEADYLIDFDWMGLQRHIKVLGIFSRLYLRDEKPAYLGDLPRVMAYLVEVLYQYPEEPALVDFLDWFREQVVPRARDHNWYGDSL